MVETICPNCGNRKSFEDSFVGKTFKCPSCSNPVTIQILGSLLNTEPVSQTNSFAQEIALAESKAVAEKEAKIQLEEQQKKIKKKRKIIIIAGVIFVILMYNVWGLVKPIYIKSKIENYIEDNYKLISESIAKEKYSEIKDNLENWKYSDSDEIKSRLFAYPTNDLAGYSFGSEFMGEVTWRAMTEMGICKGLKRNECDEIYQRHYNDFYDTNNKFWNLGNPLFDYYSKYADSFKKILIFELKNRDNIAIPQDGYQNITNNNEENLDLSGTFTIKVEKCNFYSKPDLGYVKKSFLVLGQSGNYEKIVNGFAYVTYTNSNNVSTSGWLPIDELEIAPNNSYDSSGTPAAAD